ncbi:site-specific integrase [Christensenellaceae bacterium OttesenSCG-928-K19]|nr:site-specific integrase [Christensenellaceae bacterium OttesenSCG-928-K19]
MPRKSTRNAQGDGSIRKRKEGSWEGRYTLGRNPGTGKQEQKSVYGKTQNEVRQKLKAITTAIDNGVYVEPAKLSLAEWLDIWLTEYCGHIKPLTKVMYESQITKHIKPALGAVKLKALHPHMIQKFYNKLGTSTGEKPALSAKTIKNLHGVLHRALAQAMELGYIQINPTGACKLPRVVKPEIKPLEDEQVAMFLKKIQGHKFERIFIVDLFTGLRRAEVIGLTWDCVDFKNGTLHIYQQLQRIGKEYKFVPLKNDKARTITPAPFVMDVLRKQRTTQKEWKLKAGQAWHPWQGYSLVFSDELGNHLAHQTVYDNFKGIVKKLGIPNTRFHDLRHTYAVASLQSGDDVKTVQENLGHHTAAFTLDTYAHVTEKMKQESAQRFQTYIESVITDSQK